MNQVSQAGLAIARRIAAVYRTNPNVQAVLVSGSVARGYADHYSDLEIGVFWATPPTDVNRTTVIQQLGGDLWSLTSYTTDPEWAVTEHYGLSIVEMNGHTHRLGDGRYQACHTGLPGTLLQRRPGAV